MQYAGTVVALGDAPFRDAATLDATALSCVLVANDFREIKRTPGGSVLVVLCAEADDPALAAAAKVARIFRQMPLVVLPALPVNPGPQATARLERAARLTQACVVRPIEPATWSDAVRCFVEPLAVFGLIGVEPREIHQLISPRAALLHRSVADAVPQARDVLVTCRLRPNASLREVDDAARAVAGRAPKARLILAGPEVGLDDGPRVVAASLF
ncbi:MAG: hypothetical protein LC689_12520 [Myxococcales bacterium]|nr:hypothetical protein [Myxococcales bacterium]